MLIKYTGIICLVKRKSEKILYIEVIASDSVYYKGITYSNHILNQGMQISFHIISKKNICFFIIEDVSNFFGYFFWEDHVILNKLTLLFRICSINLPDSVHIEHLYENFIYQLKYINSDKSNLKDFENWILSLS